MGNFSKNIPVPRPTPLLQQKFYDNFAELTASSLISENLVTAYDAKSHSSQKSVAPQLLLQKALSNLVKDLELTKDKSELLASRLK